LVWSQPPSDHQVEIFSYVCWRIVLGRKSGMSGMIPKDGAATDETSEIETGIQPQIQREGGRESSLVGVRGGGGKLNLTLHSPRSISSPPI